jgi:hypothetical protein
MPCLVIADYGAIPHSTSRNVDTSTGLELPRILPPDLVLCKFHSLNLPQKPLLLVSFIIGLIPRRLQQHTTPTAPSDRLIARDGRTHDGYFFPGEVARILAIDVIDYRQLRRFYRLIREQSDHAVPSGWSRYTLTDIACLAVAIEICGGPEALEPGSRLVLAKLERVCQLLVQQGISNPLLRVSIGRRGRSITVDLDGVVTEPETGQIIMEAASKEADHYFSDSLLRDRKLARALRAEIDQFRKKTKKT